MIKKLPDDIADKIRDDKLDHRLVIAKYHLEKIKGKFNLGGGWDHLYFMTHFEYFVFFASNAIEIITHEINDEFSLTDNEWKKTIYRISDKLDSSIKPQKKIKEIISQYFENPSEQSSFESGSKSSLWCLREIRNILAHGKFFIRTVGTGHGYGFEIPYPIKEGKKVVGINRYPVLDFDEYFNWIYSSLEEFATKIRVEIPKTYHSEEHKHTLDFDL